MVVDNTISKDKSFPGVYTAKRSGYEYRRNPDHPHANPDHPYIGRHVLVMEEYLSILFDKEIFIPKGWDVHHIKPMKEGGNNALINLELITRKDHRRIHMIGNHIDTSDRRCFNCGSDKTFIKKPNGKDHKTPYPVWNHLPNDKVNWYCGRCWQKIKRELARTK